MNLIKQLTTGVLFLLINGAVMAQIEFNASSSNFTGVLHSAVAVADIDMDGDLDLAIAGDSLTPNMQFLSLTFLYENDGNGNFTKINGAGIEGLSRGSMAFSDIDLDGDPDLLINGETTIGADITKMYRNDGSGNFTEISGLPFDRLKHGSISFFNMDNDNDPDLLLTGNPLIGNASAKLYRNNGSGGFSIVPSTPFTGVEASDSDVADIDGDGDLDVLIAGENGNGTAIAELFTNDGFGNFTLVSGTPFAGVKDEFGGDNSIAFADADGDGDPDVLLTGWDNSSKVTAKLYANDGNGNFTEVTGTPFKGVVQSSVAFSDVDNDGDQDVLVTGSRSFNSREGALYENKGNLSFVEVNDGDFVNLSNSSVAFFDADGDGDEDCIQTGQLSNADGFAELLINDSKPCVNSSDTVDVYACNAYIVPSASRIITTVGVQTVLDTIDNAIGCDSFLTINLTLDTLTINVLQQGDSLYTPSSGGFTYQWFSCDNGNNPILITPVANGPSFTPSENGNYSVSATKGNCNLFSDCISYSSSTDSTVTHASDGVPPKNTTIYPNPFTQAFTVELPADASAHQLRLLDVQGKEVLRRENITQTTIQISHSALSSGLYLLEVQGEWGIQRKKLIRR